jgi:chemotaxis protein MotB
VAQTEDTAVAQAPAPVAEVDAADAPPPPKPFGPDDCPKCEECPPCVKGAPAWMSTFADMATLLMAFFVLILSFAEMNVPKFKQINGSLKNSFGVQRLIPVVESPKAQSIIAQHFSPSVSQPTPINTIRQQTTDDRKENVELKTDVSPEVKQAMEAMMQALAQEISRGEVQVKAEAGKVVVEMNTTPSGGGAGQSGAQRGGASNGASQGGAGSSGASQGGAASSGSSQAGSASSGASQGGSAASGSSQAGASASGQQAGGAAASGAQAGASAARGEKQGGAVSQGEIEFYAKVAQVQAQVAAGVEVRDMRSANASAASSSGSGGGKGSGNVDAELARIRQSLSQEIASGKAEVERDGARIIIRLAEQGSFRSGSADLQPGFMQVLGQVGKTIASSSGRIFIEGHTDNVPVVYNERFRSNWDLSAARSGAVADYMAALAGVPAARMSVSGYADTRPLDSNDSAAGRSRNRRIEVIVDGAGG